MKVWEARGRGTEKIRRNRERKEDDKEQEDKDTATMEQEAAEGGEEEQHREEGEVNITAPASRVLHKYLFYKHVLCFPLRRCKKKSVLPYQISGLV